MTRFDGNSILIADCDCKFSNEIIATLSEMGAKCFFAKDISSAKKLMAKYDFDLVISNYYLADGLIFQLIDWSADNLKFLPIFTCVGWPIPSEVGFSQKHSIVDIFSKSDTQRLVKGISRLLFDFNQFYESLMGMVAPEELMIELQVGEYGIQAKPIEISDEKIYLNVFEKLERGTFGVLKFSFKHEGVDHRFNIPGHVESVSSSGHCFQIHPHYLMNWERFLNYLNKKQVNITDFMHKASGF